MPPNVRLAANVVVGTLLLAPLIAVLYALSSDAIGTLFSMRVLELWGRTFAVATGAALASCVLGAAAGILLGLQRDRFTPYLLALLGIPLLLPPYVLCLAWVDLLARGGLLARLAPATDSPSWFFGVPGLIFVFTLTWYPVPMLFGFAALRSIDPDILDAARLHGKHIRCWSRIILSACRGPLLIAFGIVAVNAWLAYAVPSLMQVHVLTVQVYSAFSAFQDVSMAAVTALPIISGGVLLFSPALYTLIKSPHWKAQTGWRNARTHSGPAPAARLGTAALAMFTVLLPLTAIATRARPVFALPEAWQAAGDEVVTTLWTSGAAGFFALFLAVLLITLSPRGVGLPTVAGAVLFLCSGPVLAIGLIRMLNRPGIAGELYDSPWILVIALGLRYFVFADLTLRIAWSRLDRRMLDAAATCGAGQVSRAVRIVVPQLLPAAVLAFLVVFVLSASDADLGVLLAPPGYTSLAARIFALLHYGPGDVVARLSLLFLCILLAAGAGMLVAYKYWTRWQETRPHAQPELSTAGQRHERTAK